MDNYLSDHMNVNVKEKGDKSLCVQARVCPSIRALHQHIQS